MAKYCPIYQRTVLYLDCQECDNKRECKTGIRKQKRKIVIGIDQSYKNTGISIALDGVLKQISNLKLSDYKNNSERRKALKDKLNFVFDKFSRMAQNNNYDLQIIIERIRLTSQGFLNIDYIKSIGALNALIVDIAYKYHIDVYSVDTRAWKSAVVGTSKPKENKYGIDPKKWPTLCYLIKEGYENNLLRPVSNRKNKGVVKIIEGQKYIYDDDAADSACIALYGFTKNQKLEVER